MIINIIYLLIFNFPHDLKNYHEAKKFNVVLNSSIGVVVFTASTKTVAPCLKLTTKIGARQRCGNRKAASIMLDIYLVAVSLLPAPPVSHVLKKRPEFLVSFLIELKSNPSC